METKIEHSQHAASHPKNPRVSAYSRIDASAPLHGTKGPQQPTKILRDCADVPGSNYFENNALSKF